MTKISTLTLEVVAACSSQKFNISSDDKVYLHSRVKTIHFMQMHLFVCTHNMHIEAEIYEEFWYMKKILQKINMN